ncbi:MULTISPECIES: hypothetical protein [unclassified Microcoleus]|nr:MULTISPECIES: hypothetical protein [unclassified Microcoleus]
MPKTHSYHDYLIESLKEIEESAAYIQAILEEEAPEPELLLTVLRDVVKSQSEVSTIAQEELQNWEKLQELLKSSGGEEIYRFIGLLKTLGLKTQIGVRQKDCRQSGEYTRVLAQQLFDNDKTFISELEQLQKLIKNQDDSNEASEFVKILIFFYWQPKNRVSWIFDNK